MSTEQQAYTYRGHCRCGNIVYQLRLPQSLSRYTSRVCDCDFCQQRHAQYISDANGLLDIKHSASLNVRVQGTEQANFLCCAHCDELIAVTCEFKLDEQTETRGAINLNSTSQEALTPQITLKPATSVSPKTLSASERRDRWQQVWMPVTLSASP